MARPRSFLKSIFAVGAMTAALVGCGTTSDKGSGLDASVADATVNGAGGSPGINVGGLGGSAVQEPDAGADTAAPVVPPSGMVLRAGGITSLGGIVTSGTLSLYDDGFEVADRACSADGVLCVTGGIVP